MMQRTLYIIVLACAGATVSIRAAEWPQFRGPTGQGHSSEVGLPLEWGESRNIAWKTRIDGGGWSSPVVSNGRVWLTAARESGRSVSLRAVSLDVASGKVVLDVEVFKVATTDTPLNPKNSRASPTPIVDGSRVFVHFGPDGTAALSTAGEILWKRKLTYEPQHGGGGSPALYRDLLIVNCDGNGDEAYVIALDAATGKTRWRKDRRKPSAQAYSTPLITRIGDRDVAISVGAFRTAALDPLTGNEIWRVRYDDGFSNIPRPVAGNGLIFIATGFNAPTLIAVRAEGAGDVTRSHIAWTLSRWRTVYAIADSGRKPAVLCQRHRRVDVRGCAIRPNPVAAADRRELFRVTGPCRRADLFPERRGCHHGDRRGPGIPPPRREHTRRTDARIDGGVGWGALYTGRANRLQDRSPVGRVPLDPVRRP